MCRRRVLRDGRREVPAEGDFAARDGDVCQQRAHVLQVGVTLGSDVKIHGQVPVPRAALAAVQGAGHLPDDGGGAQREEDGVALRGGERAGA